MGCLQSARRAERCSESCTKDPVVGPLKVDVDPAGPLKVDVVAESYSSAGREASSHRDTVVELLTADERAVLQADWARLTSTFIGSHGQRPATEFRKLPPKKISTKTWRKKTCEDLTIELRQCWSRKISAEKLPRNLGRSQERLTQFRKSVWETRSRSGPEFQNLDDLRGKNFGK